MSDSRAAGGDPAFASATELARRIRAGELGSEELVDHYLARIEAHDPRIGAVVTLDADRARQRAREADRARARGELRGPLHGVPITVKDTLETAGLRTTAGHPPLAEHVPAETAPAVARLLAAGAILLGKTNTPALAGDWQTHNAIFGTTRNPWDPTRTPGGSSGGSAAALAAGLSALELGSDIGGSIRVPASWCGVYGHKPTHGIVPHRGHIPGPPGTLSEPDLSVVGPLARSAEDLALALDLLAGPLPDRAVAWRLELPPPRARDLRELRIAAWIHDPEFEPDPGVALVLEEALDALRREGARIDPGARPVPRVRDALEVYERVLWPVFLAGYPEHTWRALEAVASRSDPGDRSPLAVMARCGTVSHREWLAAHEARERLRARLRAFFADFDVLLLPVCQVPAIPLDPSEPQTARTIRVAGAERPYADLFAWIALATACHLPATVVPAGRSPEGLPVGLQVVGPFLEDRTPLAFAAAFARLRGGFSPPPAFA